MCNPWEEAKKVVKGGGDLILGGLDVIGSTASNILKNPLPTIETAALIAVGVDPAIASATVTAMNGGSVQDIAVAAAVSYTAQQAGGYAGEQYSPIETQTLQQLGPQYADELLIKQIVTSSSGAAAATALRGGNMNQILTSAVSAAVAPAVSTTLKEQYGMEGVDNKVLTNSISAATKAILNGQSVADAVGQSVAATALSAGIQSGVNSLAEKTGIANSLKSTFDDLKKGAQSAYENLTGKKTQLDSQVQTTNNLVNDFNTKQTAYNNEYNNWKSLYDAASSDAGYANYLAGKGYQSYNFEVYSEGAYFSETQIGYRRVVGYDTYQDWETGAPYQVPRYENAPDKNTIIDQANAKIDSLNKMAEGVQSSYSAATNAVKSLDWYKKTYADDLQAYNTNYVEPLNKLKSDYEAVNQDIASISTKLGEDVSAYEREAAKGAASIAEQIASKAADEAKQTLETTAKDLGFKDYSEQQTAIGLGANTAQEYKDFVSGKTEEQKVIQMLEDRGITPTPERVAGIMKEWNFSLQTPNVGFSDAFDKSDNINISNERADTIQEAAALAKSLGYSSFDFGGSKYKIDIQAPQTNPYDFFTNFGEAFKAARADLGPGQVFQWTDPQTGKSSYFTTNTAGEKVSGGDFDNSAAFKAKAILNENLQDMKMNPADLTAAEMSKFVDNFVKATPEQRSALLNGKDSLTYQSINSALTTTQQSLDTMREQIASGKLDLTKPMAEPSGTIKASDVTNYKQVLGAVGNNIATDLASTALSGAVAIGSALGLDTADIERVQKFMTDDKNKQMNKLVGLEKNAAAGLASGIESAFSYALGGAPGAIGSLTAFAANNAWLEGKDAGMSNADNGLRTATMAALEAAGEAVGIPGLSKLMKGIPMTGSPADIINGVKNAALALGNEELSELATTAAEFAFDKWSKYGIGKNATVQDFQDAMVDTALSTAFAVGGAGSVGQATTALRNASTAPTEQIRTPVTPEQLWDQAAQAGVSSDQLNSFKNQIANSYGSQGYTVQEIKQNLASELEKAGFTQQEIERMSAPAVTDVLSDSVKSSLESAGVPADKLDAVSNQIASKMYSAPDTQSIFNDVSFILQSAGIDPVKSNVVANKTLTGTDVRALIDQNLKAQGYTPTQQDIDNLISQNSNLSADQITQNVTSFAEPLVVTKEEARQALIDAGVTNPTEFDINALIGQYQEATLAQKATEAKPMADIRSAVRDVIGEGGTVAIDQITVQMQANEAAGQTRDQALTNAIQSVAQNVGTTKEELLGAIGKTEDQLRSEMAAGQQQLGEQIVGVKSALEQQIGTLSQQTQNQYNSLSDAQKAEVQARVQQGQDLQAAITASQQATQAQIGSLSQQTQQQYESLTAAQKAEVDARVAQGETLQNAITQAQQQTQQQIQQSQQQTTEQITNLQNQVLDQYKSLDAGMQKEVDARVQMGQSLQDAIAGVQKQIADDKAAAAAAQAAKDAAAAKAAQAASQQSAIQSALGMLAVPGAAAAATAAAAETEKPLEHQVAKIKGKGGYEGLLSPFFQEVGTGDYLTDNSTTNAQTGDLMMPTYFNYGSEAPIDQIMAGDDQQTNDEPQLPYAMGGAVSPLMGTGTRYGQYATGGMATPLMAAGGKMRVDFRGGDAVTGPGDGQSDDIPAMLADGEFVIPADVVAAIGNGSTKAGSDKLYDMMHGIRKHVRSAHHEDLPPEIKSPLDFLKTAPKKGGKKHV